ncbi:MAG: hypothetical protein ACI8XM_000751 [Haloarculaceae archaeon]|jgi:hypothetical protein
MCFSNLPIEFDEQGNPHLVDDAEEDGAEEDGTHEPTGVAERATREDGLDPEHRYDAILDDLPDRAREHLDTKTDHRADHSHPVD